MRYVSRWLAWLTQGWMMWIVLGLIVLSYYCIDQPLDLYMYHLRLGETFPILNGITQLGRAVPYLLLLPCVALYFRYIKRSKQLELRWWFMWLALVMANVICFGLKIMLGRARPELLFSQQLFGFYGFNVNSLYHSYPSGHTTLVTALVLSLTLVLPSWRKWFIALGLAIVTTRILLTYHYLSDVLASFYLVVLEYRLLFHVIKRQCPLYWKRLGLV